MAKTIRKSKTFVTEGLKRGRKISLSEIIIQRKIIKKMKIHKNIKYEGTPINQASIVMAPNQKNSGLLVAKKFKKKYVASGNR